MPESGRPGTGDGYRAEPAETGVTGAPTAAPAQSGATTASAGTPDAEPANALGSLGGIALAVTMISVASALFARL
jgi:hypothetical protein